MLIFITVLSLSCKKTESENFSKIGKLTLNEVSFDANRNYSNPVSIKAQSKTTVEVWELGSISWTLENHHYTYWCEGWFGICHITYVFNKPKSFDDCNSCNSTNKIVLEHTIEITTENQIILRIKNDAISRVNHAENIFHNSKFSLYHDCVVDKTLFNELNIKKEIVIQKGI